MGRMKDLFIVEKPEGGTRLSEAMITNVVMLVSSALVAAGGVGQAIAGAEQAAIVGGIYAIWNIGVRWRSKGGTIKAKDDGWRSGDDDSGMGI